MGKILKTIRTKEGREKKTKEGEVRAEGEIEGMREREKKRKGKREGGQANLEGSSIGKEGLP